MFYFDNFFGKKVLKSTLLDDCEHFFTTRDFVLSAGTLKNLEKQAAENVDFLTEKLNITKKSLYRCRQMHTSNIAIADSDDNFFENTDGIILTKENTATFLNFADCVPIILYDSKTNTGAVVHAGWRGTAMKIQQKAVKMMCENGSEPENIKAAIGPSIGLCCFEVDEDVFNKIIDEKDKVFAENEKIFHKNEETQKYFIDLKKVNKMLLNQLSVNQTDVSDYCTCCSNDVFFSYRKENGNTARHSAVLKIKG